jgi:hypothetical protein
LGGRIGLGNTLQVVKDPFAGIAKRLTISLKSFKGVLNTENNFRLKLKFGAFSKKLYNSLFCF